MITKDLDYNKFYNLRLYGCFGSNERDGRLLKRFLTTDGPFVLKDDREFDYISISDFYRTLHYVINNNTYRNIDCVYYKKRTLSEFLRLFCDINNIDKEIIVESTSNNNYTGESAILDIIQSQGLELYGIMHGMKEYMK
jgi:hypothetical protein